MAFRGGNNRRNFGGNFGGGGGGRQMNPWDNQIGNFGGNMRQGSGGPMNAEALSLANNLLSNLLRNQNPPSLLDLPRGSGGGGMGGNRGPRGQMGNRGVGGGNRNNRRAQGGGGFGGNRGNQKSGANNQKGGGGIRKQNAFDRAKKLLAKNSNKKKDSTPGEKTDNKKSESNSVRESIYGDVPNDMFYCHLCKKHMWDSNSFENHIKGRTHLMMREGIEESYRLKANMIRQEAKIAEQLKSIELDRLKRMGKSGKAHAREYCTMCDLNFHGHLSQHRKSEGHLALKKFLHPKCIECSKEFPTRIEFDTHLLTPEHLKKAAEKNTKVGERKKNNLTILTEEDELRDVRPPTKRKKKVEVKKEEDGSEEKKENGEEVTAETGEDGEKNDEKASDMNETKEGDESVQIKEEEEEEDVQLAEDPEDCIIDFTDGDDIPAEVDARLPKYNWTRSVGSSLISKLECYECSLCAKFFDTEKTAEIHSRTVSHHRQFTKFLNEKSSDTKIAQKRAAAAVEESERKRRRIEEAAAAENDENGEKDNDVETSGDLYDPSEATGDDDVDMSGECGDDAGDIDMDATAEAGDDDDTDMKQATNLTVKPNTNTTTTPSTTNANVVGANGGTTEIKQETHNDKNGQETVVPDTSIQDKPKEIIKEEPEPVKQQASPVKQQQSPAMAANKTPGRGAAVKGTPRGRGRGRYNRY